MTIGEKKDSAIRFLIRSFILLLIFSVAIFSFLGSYMNKKSEKAVYSAGEFYMTGMNEQMAKNFENVMELRFNQVRAITSVVSAENFDRDELYHELVYRAQVRGFDYLALCSEEGTFESLCGQPITPLNPKPFVDALKKGEQRVAVGFDVNGNEVVLFGVDAAYPMQDGSKGTGLIAAVPLDYITGFLSTESKNQLMYYHIVRPDGSFVIQNSNTELWDFFEQLQKGEQAAERMVSTADFNAFTSALEHRRAYSTLLTVAGEKRHISGIALPYSEWYLVAVMPYGVLDDVVNGLSNQRIVMSLLSCGLVIIILTFIFIRYFSMTRAQIRELEETRQNVLAASKAKSEFLANMSHDIRTPMNAIVGMTAIALNHIDDREQVQDCLKKITRSSKQLLGLINDVLDMSKIESGKMILNPEPISIKETVEENVSIMQPQMELKNQTLAVCVENITSENILCDGVRLNQVLLNLLSNATKYTPGNGAIQFSLYEEESPKGDGYIRVHIRVKDNGIGMSPEFLTKIYDAYSRADEERIHKTEGAGLGMAITRCIVDAMDGSIEVSSELGKGTEFHLFFDFEKVDAMPAQSEDGMDLQGRRILLAEDNELNWEIAAAQLSNLGVEPYWAEDGQLCLDKFKNSEENYYDAILMDIRMPNMTGYEAAEAIRRLNRPDAATVPIIAMSADAFSDDIQRCLKCGMNAHIAKPINVSELTRLLKKYCR